MDLSGELSSLFAKGQRFRYDSMVIRRVHVDERIENIEATEGTNQQFALFEFSLRIFSVVSFESHVIILEDTRELDSIKGKAEAR
jgi:hypothetical protein